jgi:hypothetical protein
VTHLSKEGPVSIDQDAADRRFRHPMQAGRVEAHGALTPASRYSNAIRIATPLVT